GSVHVISAPNQQAGAPGAQFVFTGWTDGAPASHTIYAQASVTTYTAAFASQYQLTTAAVGGTVTPATAFFNAGATVNVNAAASPGFHFVSWQGAVTAASPGYGTVVMNQPQSITAV